MTKAEEVYHSTNVALSYIKVDEIIFRCYILLGKDKIEWDGGSEHTPSFAIKSLELFIRLGILTISPRFSQNTLLWIAERNICDLITSSTDSQTIGDDADWDFLSSCFSFSLDIINLVLATFCGQEEFQTVYSSLKSNSSRLWKHNLFMTVVLDLVL